MEHLDSFIYSAADGGFSAAARRLGLTPAGVSKNVARLEANLGVRLFRRSTRKLSLTEEGEQLLREVAEMGIDPAVLFPSDRLDEVATALRSRDVEEARQVVRTMAPAANRRVARRLYTDEKLKRQAHGDA